MPNCEVCGDSYRPEELTEIIDYDGRRVYACEHCLKVIREVDEE